MTNGFTVPGTVDLGNRSHFGFAGSTATDDGDGVGLKQNEVRGSSPCVVVAVPLARVSEAECVAAETPCAKAGTAPAPETTPTAKIVAKAVNSHR